MAGIEGGGYQPPQSKEAAFNADPLGGGGGDSVGQTPEAGESQFAYPLKPLAQRCLAQMRFYEKEEFPDEAEIREHIDYTLEELRKADPYTSDPIQLTHALISHLSYSRLAVAHMLVTDHEFFQGKSQDERWPDHPWTERDKRFLFDAALEADTVDCQIALATDTRLRTYYPEECNHGEMTTLLDEDREMYSQDIRTNRQLQRQLRQRGQVPAPRKVIPIR